MSLSGNEAGIVPLREQREPVSRRSIVFWQSSFDETRFATQLPPALDFHLSLQQVPSFTITWRGAHASRITTPLHAKRPVTWLTGAGIRCVAQIVWVTMTVLFHWRIDTLSAKDEDMGTDFLAIRDGIALSIGQNHCFRSWPDEDGCMQGGSNYVTTLTPASAFIPSRVWDEPQNGSVAFTDDKAPVCFTARLWSVHVTRSAAVNQPLQGGGRLSLLLWKVGKLRNLWMAPNISATVRRR